MVIEYSGIVIRSVLTDKREKYYDGKVRETGFLLCSCQLRQEHQKPPDFNKVLAKWCVKVS